MLRDKFRDFARETGAIGQERVDNVNAIIERLIDAGHFPTENPVMPRLADRLRALCAARGWDVEVLLADQKTPLRLLWPKT